MPYLPGHFLIWYWCSKFFLCRGASIYPNIVLERQVGVLIFLCCSFNFLTCLWFQENHGTDALLTNDDILGDSIPFNQQDALRQFCYQALKLGTGVGTSMAYVPVYNFWVLQNIPLHFILFLRIQRKGTDLGNLFGKLFPLTLSVKSHKNFPFLWEHS